MTRITISITTTLAFLCLVCSSQEVESTNRAAWKKISSWRVPMPKVRVVSGCELLIDGVRCRLFGVQLPKDAAQAASAKRFLEFYIKNYGDYFSIYNTDNPVSSKDGVPLIWLHGHGNGGWAQETLVEAGLLSVDYGGHEEYRFRVPAKSGEEEFDWKKCLKEAVSSHQAGKKPNVNFDCPESRPK